MLDESEQHRAIRRTAFVGRFSSAARIEEDTPAEIVVAPGRSASSTRKPAMRSSPEVGAQVQAGADVGRLGTRSCIPA